MYEIRLNENIVSFGLFLLFCCSWLIVVVFRFILLSPNIQTLLVLRVIRTLVDLKQTLTRNLQGCPSTPWPMHPGCPAEFRPGQLVLGELCPVCACSQPCLSLLCDLTPSVQAPCLLRYSVTWFQACLWAWVLLLLTGPHELDFRSTF